MIYRPGFEPIPGFRLIRFLGKGQFGQVWEAKAPGGVHIALKFLDLTERAGRKEFRAIQRVKGIRHAHLAPITGIWLLDEQDQILAEDAAEDFGEESTGVHDTVGYEGVRDSAGEPALLIVAQQLGDQTLEQRFAACREQRAQEKRAKDTAKGIAATMKIADGDEAPATDTQPAKPSADDLGGIPVKELLRYIEEAAKGIDFLNERRHDLSGELCSIQHLDIKPANILLVGDSVQITDYGLARALSGKSSSIKATQQVGTLAYMSPECYRCEPGDRSDLYSLAITYVELRTGQLPYQSQDFSGVQRAFESGRLQLDALDPAVRKVIRRATSTQPHRRYRTAGEMVAALKQAELQQPGLPWKRIAAALGAVAAVALAIVLYYPSGRSPEVVPADAAAQRIQALEKYLRDVREINYGNALDELSALQHEIREKGISLHEVDRCRLEIATVRCLVLLDKDEEARNRLQALGSDADQLPIVAPAPSATAEDLPEQTVAGDLRFSLLYLWSVLQSPPDNLEYLYQLRTRGLELDPDFDLADVATQTSPSRARKLLLENEERRLSAAYVSAKEYFADNYNLDLSPPRVRQRNELWPDLELTIQLRALAADLAGIPTGDALAERLNEVRRTITAKGTGSLEQDATNQLALTSVCQAFEDWLAIHAPDMANEAHDALAETLPSWNKGMQEVTDALLRTSTRTTTATQLALATTRSEVFQWILFDAGKAADSQTRLDWNRYQTIDAATEHADPLLASVLLDAALGKDDSAADPQMQRDRARQIESWVTAINKYSVSSADDELTPAQRVISDFAAYVLGLHSVQRARTPVELHAALLDLLGHPPADQAQGTVVTSTAYQMRLAQPLLTAMQKEIAARLFQPLSVEQDEQFWKLLSNGINTLRVWCPEIVRLARDPDWTSTVVSPDTAAVMRDHYGGLRVAASWMGWLDPEMRDAERKQVFRTLWATSGPTEFQLLPFRTVLDWATTGISAEEDQVKSPRLFRYTDAVLRMANGKVTLDWPKLPCDPQEKTTISTDQRALALFYFHHGRLLERYGAEVRQGLQADASWRSFDKAFLLAADNPQYMFYACDALHKLEKANHKLDVNPIERIKDYLCICRMKDSFQFRAWEASLLHTEGSQEPRESAKIDHFQQADDAYQRAIAAAEEEMAQSPALAGSLRDSMSKTQIYRAALLVELGILQQDNLEALEGYYQDAARCCQEAIQDINQPEMRVLAHTTYGHVLEDQAYYLQRHLEGQQLTALRTMDQAIAQLRKAIETSESVFSTRHAKPVFGVARCVYRRTEMQGTRPDIRQSQIDALDAAIESLNQLVADAQKPLTRGISAADLAESHIWLARCYRKKRELINQPDAKLAAAREALEHFHKCYERSSGVLRLHACQERLALLAELPASDELTQASAQQEIINLWPRLITALSQAGSDREVRSGLAWTVLWRKKVVDSVGVPAAQLPLPDLARFQDAYQAEDTVRSQLLKLEYRLVDILRRELSGEKAQARIDYERVWEELRAFSPTVRNDPAYAKVLTELEYATHVGLFHVSYDLFERDNQRLLQAIWEHGADAAILHTQVKSSIYQFTSQEVLVVAIAGTSYLQALQEPAQKKAWAERAERLSAAAREFGVRDAAEFRALHEAIRRL